MSERRWIATNPPNAEDYTSGWTPTVLESERDAATYRRLGWQVDEVASVNQLAGAVEALERVGKLAAWIERDRRATGKVIVYAQEIAALVACSVAASRQIMVRSQSHPVASQTEVSRREAVGE